MNSVVAKNEDDGGDFTDELQPGSTLLQGQFVIEGFLNSGGFGMTYLAKDSLDRTVVIKECFPATVCRRTAQTVRARSQSHQKDFRSIVRLFLQEARQLAKLRHPNIVGVHQVFEDNETAYMALDFVDGLDMLDIIEDGQRKITPAELRPILLKILEAVGFMHSRNILHRDISPDNILIDTTGNPVLIDFGAAREKATKASRAMSALLVVKDGYSPQEFYIAGSEQGPFSDLYALAASIYHLITGEAPPHSQTRLAAIAQKQGDPYAPLKGRIKGHEPVFLAAIDKALNIFPKDRFQSAQEWALEIGTDVADAPVEVPVPDIDLDRSISQLVSETNEAVKKAIEKKSKEPKVVEKSEAPVSKLRAKFAEIARELAMDAEPDAEPDPKLEKPEVIEETAAVVQAPVVKVSRVAPKPKANRAELLRQAQTNKHPIPQAPKPAASTKQAVADPDEQSVSKKQNRRKWFSKPAEGQGSGLRFWGSKKSKTSDLGKAGL